MLADPWPLERRTAPSRVLFGPHVTNLGRDRAFSDDHVAYYARRARGGCGVVVTETISVHESDWPYERAPLASACGASLRAVARAVHDHGSLCVASLGHAGLQGTTAYSQGVLWAPSLVPHVVSHEMPLEMEEEHVQALLDGLLAAAQMAREAGCDGVELNAGQFSLFRQFLSGLTNLRGDRWADRPELVRRALDELDNGGDIGVLGLRVTVDELAPWAGITVEQAASWLPTLASFVDYVVLERGGLYADSATRPDMHDAPGFNELALRTLAAVDDRRHKYVAQGSLVDVAQAESWLGEGLVAAVEMTRAQIADPDLVRRVRDGHPEQVRPCVLCNQGCQVRDVRNPRVSCTVNPAAGYERSEPALDDGDLADGAEGTATVVGGGPAGLEAAHALARRGVRVTLRERGATLGGALHLAARLPGRARWTVLAEWYATELARLGVTVELGRSGDGDLDARGAQAPALVLREGTDGSVPVVAARDCFDAPLPDGPVLVWDPLGGVVGVGVAEWWAAKGRVVTILSPDLVPASQLTLTGDFVPANRRLAAAKVAFVGHAQPVAVRDGGVEVQDRFSGTMTTLPAAVVIDAGAEVPATPIAARLVIGDALAPRIVASAVLEGRRAAIAWRASG